MQKHYKATVKIAQQFRIY